MSEETKEEEENMSEGESSETSEAGVLLEAGTRVPAPVYSEHSTRLRRNRSQVDKYEIKSQTETSFHRFPALPGESNPELHL